MAKKKPKTSKSSRRTFTKEFKQEAVQMLGSIPQMVFP